jgi:hypothetical protein
MRVTPRAAQGEEVSQERASAAIDLSQHTLGRVEACRRELRVSEWLALAAELDVPPLDLLLPEDGDEPVQVAPNFELVPRVARCSIVGRARTACTSPRTCPRTRRRPRRG